MLDQDASAIPTHRPTQSLTPTQVHLERLTEIIALRFGQKVVVSDLHFTPLNGTHQVWECAFEINAQTNTHTQTHTERLIVKQLHTHAGQAFSFESTFALQQQLFSMGLAAEPIYLSPENTLWVESYVFNIKAANIKAANIKSNIKMPSPATPQEILARALAQLHCVGLAKTSGSTKTSTIRQLDPIAQCQMLINTVQNTSSSRQAGELTLALDNLLTEFAALINSHDELVLCHNDLHLNHVRADYMCGDFKFAGYKCVDWEYAAMGPRYFDLAMCIVINQLSVEQQTQLLQVYAQQTHCNAATVKQQTELYVRLAQIINQAWALLV